MAELEEEIQQLQNELEKVQLDQNCAQQREARAAEKTLAMRSQKSRKEEYLAARPQTQSSYINYSVLEGIFKWKPLLFAPPFMSFQFLGCFAESSVSLSFDVSKGSTAIGCRAKIDPSTYRPKPGAVRRKLTRSGAACLKRNIGEVVKRFSSKPLKSHSEIGPLLVNLDWQFGRLEALSVELSAIESRNKSNILLSNGKTAFEMELSGCIFTFTLCTNYPTEPMKMQIDVLEKGKIIDIPKLKRHLMKHVKPGHQYLTRLVNCIETYAKV